MVSTAEGDIDPRHRAARTALLQALHALDAQLGAIVIAGAQAVYLRAGPATPGVATFTTDADIALDPTQLVADPVLEDAMGDAGFALMTDKQGHKKPGVWTRLVRVADQDIKVPVELIVPATALPPSSRRGAALGPHGRRAARWIRGLEGVLVDNSVLTVGPVDEQGPRIDVRVAGPTALIVAKIHKLADRLRKPERPDRVHDKDAADTYRLMQVLRPAEAVPVLNRMIDDARSTTVTFEALDLLPELFGSRRAVGVVMAARALRGGIPEARVRAICTEFAESVRESMRR